MRTLKKNGASLIGFGDVSVVGSDLTSNYPIAISFGVKYDKRLVENLNVDEESFHHHVEGLTVPIKQLISIIENLLNRWGYKYAIIPINVLIKDNKQLRELNTFPHKTAATSAGLGWIGKCALLITPEYGPRIKLGMVLTNARFKTAEPIISDHCGRCTLCIEACPYGAISNVNWERGIEREKLFDAYVCNEERLDSIPVLGRKHSCGLCLQACKIGNKY